MLGKNKKKEKQQEKDACQSRQRSDIIETWLGAYWTKSPRSVSLELEVPWEQKYRASKYVDVWLQTAREVLEIVPSCSLSNPLCAVTYSLYLDKNIF